MSPHEDWVREIGRRVVLLRRARGLTQKVLARKARLSESHVYRIEQGFNMSVETLLSVARALGVAPSVFFNPAPPSGDDPGPAAAYKPVESPALQMREAPVDRVSAFVQGLRTDEKRRAIRLLRAAFPGDRR